MSMSRKQFLITLTGLGAAGALAATASTATADTNVAPKSVGGINHGGCKAMKVNIDTWRAICPGCGAKGPWEGRLDDAQGDARRHRKSGSGF